MGLHNSEQVLIPVYIIIEKLTIGTRSKRFIFYIVVSQREDMFCFACLYIIIDNVLKSVI